MHTHGVLGPVDAAAFVFVGFSIVGAHIIVKRSSMKRICSVRTALKMFECVTNNSIRVSQ